MGTLTLREYAVAVVLAATSTIVLLTTMADRLYETYLRLFGP